MSSSQPPYYASTFGDPTQHPTNAAPVGTQMGGAPNTNTAYDTTSSTTGTSGHGPHASKFANKADPRVDSHTGTMMGGSAYDAHAPYSAGISGSTGTTGVQSQPTESSGSHAGTGSRTKGEGIGKGIKSALAGIHGTGESLRGNLNAAFDKTFGDEEGAAKNSAIAQQGEREISSGQFQQRHRHH